MTEVIIVFILPKTVDTRKDDVIIKHRQRRNDMAKNVRRPQAPKPRNWLAEQVRDPNGAFRPKSIKNKIKNHRIKHPKKVDLCDE